MHALVHKPDIEIPTHMHIQAHIITYTYRRTYTNNYMHRNTKNKLLRVRTDTLTYACTNAYACTGPHAHTQAHEHTRAH